MAQVISPVPSADRPAIRLDGVSFSSGRVPALKDVSLSVGHGELAFVVDAAGQIAERLMTWTMLDHDEDLRAWLAGWKGDGGDARRFRRATITSTPATT